MDDEYVQTVVINKTSYHIYRVYYMVLDKEHHYYDAYVDGCCINLGEPFHQLPTTKQLALMRFERETNA